MSDTPYTLEDLRDDAQLVRKFLNNEIAICEKLMRTDARNIEKWRKKKLERERVRQAHVRVSNYIASTGPQNRLPGRPAQASLLPENAGEI